MSKNKKSSGKFQKKRGMRRSDYLVAIACAAIALMVVLILWGFLSRGTQNPQVKHPQETQPVVTDAPAVETQWQDGSAPTLPEETEPAVAESSEPVQTEPSHAVTTEPATESTTEPATQPTAPPQTDPPSHGGSTYIPPSPPETRPPKVVISLPYTIPGTNLEIVRVANYDGLYVEDGSQDEIENVAMMLLRNKGSEAMEFADIVLKYDDKTLNFRISALPAGGAVVVQDINRNSCASGDLTECTASIAPLDALEMGNSQVEVIDNGDNTLTIRNLTDKEIPTIRVFYKYYMKDDDVFVGGIAFTAKISNLKPGGSITVSPSHYASNGSRVVMVRTYDN